jgi:hypothetical protein
MSLVGKWWKGTKAYAGSPLGTLRSQFIISCFIVFGCFAGAIQTKVLGGTIIGFLLFAFGLLQVYGCFGLWKQIRMVEAQEEMVKKFKEEK